MSKLTYRNEIEPSTLVDQPEDVKLSMEQDLRNRNTTDFKIAKEDHTVGNMLRMKLHTNPQVRFAGYRVPHPTMHTIIVKIQTAPSGGDGSSSSAQSLQTPAEALDKALMECIGDLDEFDQQLSAVTD